ncbi:MAG: hypothetical protein COA79_03140 [Planctomycetota bacterium]|nr:MAG: hypothetical protein COA79_03140 [Planctomycetota bacterium]
MKRQKNFFTLGEITISIAILGVGLLGVLSVFPVAIQNGARAVKLSDSLHKAHAVASLIHTFGINMDDYTIESSNTVGKTYTLKNMFLQTESISSFFDSDKDSLDLQINSTVVIPEFLTDHEGKAIKDELDQKIKGYAEIGNGCMGIHANGNPRLVLKRYFMTVNNEFDTMFYAFDATNRKP